MTIQSQSVSVPAVYLSNGRPMTFSYSVAEVFEKEHKNVLRDIDDLGCSAEFRRLNFEPTFRAVPGPNGATRQERCFEITKDGFTILAMGYTGVKAMAFKEAYIQRFNEMEASLRQGGPSIPPSPLGYRRIFLTLRDNGTYHVSPVPDGAVVFAPAELPKIIADSQAGTIPRSLLPAIIGAAAERLAGLPAPKPSQYPAPAKPQRPQPINPLSDALSGQIAAFLADRQATTVAEVIEAMGLPKTKASEITAGVSLRRLGWAPRQQTWNGVSGVRVYQKLWC